MIRGLPEGHCEFCGLEHSASDVKCPPLPTLGENLVVEYRRAKKRVLSAGCLQPDFSARELAGLCLTIGGSRGALSFIDSQIGLIDRIRVEGDLDLRTHEARRLIEVAVGGGDS